MGMIDNPRLIDLYRMAVLRSRLKLELEGLKSSRRSANAIVKEQFGLTGDKQKIYDQFCKIYAQAKQEAGI